MLLSTSGHLTRVLSTGKGCPIRDFDWGSKRQESQGARLEDESMLKGCEERMEGLF